MEGWGEAPDNLGGDPLAATENPKQNIRFKKKKCIRAPCFVFRKMREAGSGQVDLMCLLKMSQKKF